MRYEARRYVISILIVLLVGVAYAQQAQKVEKGEVTLKDSQKNIQISDNEITNDPKEDNKKAESEEAVEESEEAEKAEAAAAAEANKNKGKAFRATAYCLKGKTASGNSAKS